MFKNGWIDQQALGSDHYPVWIELSYPVWIELSSSNAGCQSA